MKRSIPMTGISAVAVGLLLSACATSANNSGGQASGAPTESEGVSPKLTNCTNKIAKTDAPQVSVWAWYPNMANVVDNFNDAHTDVQVCWTNAGQGNDEYDQVPDRHLGRQGRARRHHARGGPAARASQIQDALVDLSAYGANDVKGNFSEGAWKDVSSGDGVYAIPVDGGPMGMIYRKDIFEKYGITPPTTWDEFARPPRRR